MMDRTEREVGWFFDFAEWISYNPRTVALAIYLTGCIALGIGIALI